jgi:hypothetical protein
MSFVDVFGGISSCINTVLDIITRYICLLSCPYWLSKQHTIALQMLHLWEYLISVKIEFHSAENRAIICRVIWILLFNILTRSPFGKVQALMLCIIQIIAAIITRSINASLIWNMHDIFWVMSKDQRLNGLFSFCYQLC